MSSIEFIKFLNRLFATRVCYYLIDLQKLSISCSGHKDLPQLVYNLWCFKSSFIVLKYQNIQTITRVKLEKGKYVVRSEKGHKVIDFPQRLTKKHPAKI